MLTRIRDIDARMLAYSDSNSTYTHVANEVSDRGRWADYVVTVFRFEKEYYAFDWEEGLTEDQENHFWTYNDPDDGQSYVSVYMVEPYMHTETRYRKVPRR